LEIGLIGAAASRSWEAAVFWFYLDLYLVSDTKYKVRLEQTKNKD